MNGVSGPDSEDYSPWADRKVAQSKSTSPPQPQTKMSDSYSNTLPVRKSVAPKNSYATSKGCAGAPDPPSHPVVETPEGRWGTPLRHPSWILGLLRAPVLSLVGGRVVPRVGGRCWGGVSRRGQLLLPSARDTLIP